MRIQYYLIISAVAATYPSNFAVAQADWAVTGTGIDRRATSKRLEINLSMLSKHVTDQVSRLDVKDQDLQNDIDDIRDQVDQLRAIVERITSGQCTGANSFVIGFQADGSVRCGSVIFPEASAQVATSNIAQPTTSSPTPSPISPKLAPDDKGCTASKAICDAYQNVLGRVPDKGGALAWQDQYNSMIAQGYSPMSAQRQIENSMSNSSEAQGKPQTATEIAGYATYNATHNVTNATTACTGGAGCNTSGVENAISAIYQNTLGRQPETAGASYWEGLVRTGKMTIAEVQEAISNSAEAQNK